MICWLGLLIGFASAFVISFGAIVGWWFLLTRGDKNSLAHAQQEFDKIRNGIRARRAK